jgi:hypothetical protein
MLTFDVLCPGWAERADRRSNRCTGSHVPRLRAGPIRAAAQTWRRPGTVPQILMPPPDLYSQIPFPTEYSDGFTTFTPSIATRPCPHTSVTGPSHHLSRPLEDCEGCPVLAGVRNLGLDESQRRCSDLHCSFGVRSSRAASSGCSAQGRVRSSGGVPAELFVGTNGRRLRSAWHVVASMHPIHQKVSAPCDSARLPTRCHAPCQPCQAGRRSRPRLRRRQCPKRPVRQLQSLLRHTGERTWKSTLAAPRC